MKKIKNLDSELDSLLSKTILPSDNEIKLHTTSEKLAIAGSKAGIIAKKSGQLLKAASIGGKKAYSNPKVKQKFIESGKKQGKKNAESGFLDKIRTKDGSKLGGKIGFDKQCIELICPVCGANGTGRVMYKWHFDNCKNEKICQYSSDNKLIKKWKSYKELTENGFHAPSISYCCNGKKKHYKGFIWKIEK
jgi:hypothetical protein